VTPSDRADCALYRRPPCAASVDFRCRHNGLTQSHHIKIVQYIILSWVVWPGGVMVRVLARDTKGRGFDSRGRFHVQVTTLGKLFTRVCLCHQAVYFGTGQGAVMPCGWEGNRRSDVALVMRHRLQWFIYLRADGVDREMSTPPMLSCGVRPVYLYLITRKKRSETFI